MKTRWPDLKTDSQGHEVGKRSQRRSSSGEKGVGAELEGLPERGFTHVHFEMPLDKTLFAACSVF